MIQNQLKLIPLTDIKLTRLERQRTTLTPQSIYTLALSIARNGLLQNIGITTEHEIVYGERRFTAINLLKTACGASAAELELGLSEEQTRTLQLAANGAPLYENWTKIPCRLIKNTDKISRDALEFIENVSREELPWQDKAAAAFKIHKAGLAACALRNKERSEGTPLEHWRDQDTADMLDITPQYLNVLIKPLRELESASKASTQIKDAIEKSSTPLAAGNAAKAIKERHGERVTGQSKLKGKVINPKPVQKKEPEPEPEPDYIPILNADFHKWASTYNGKPFNFFHCDFPFGVGYNKGSNFNTSQSNIQQGEYDDSEDVYWGLIDTLCIYQKQLIAPEAHIMFWFSPKMRDQTKTVFRKAIPNVLIQDFEMIWVTPTKQTTPDPYRYGQRNYQSAMLLTLGDRKIVTPKRLAFVHDERATVHRSQKPIPVLSHFLSMFIDSSSRVLDPTCGSATSIITAKQLGASSVLGLELDPVAHEQAVKFWKAH